MAPVWEANHVWLIFVLTVVWTAYPDRLRIDRVDASRSRSSSPPSGSSSAASPTRSAPARPRPRELQRDRHRLLDLVGADAVRPRDGDRRHRLRPRAGRQRRRRPVHAAGSTRPRLLIGVLAVATAPIWQRSFSAPTRPGSATATSRSSSAAARSAAGLVAGGASRSPASASSHDDAHRLFHGLVERRRPAGARRLARRRAVRRSRSSGGDGTSLPATAPRSPWPRSSPAGRSRSQPLFLPGLTIEAGGAPRTTLIAVTVAVLGGRRDPVPVARPALPPHAYRATLTWRRARSPRRQAAAAAGARCRRLAPGGAGCARQRLRAPDAGERPVGARCRRRLPARIHSAGVSRRTPS